LPGTYGDWLTCMRSSQVKHFIPNLDELITPNDPDFHTSGLSVISVIRSSRLAVVSERIFVGKLGEISHERHARIRQHLIAWLHTA
jgi:mRNA interferase MazF